jgi:hypothetical protein
VSPSFFALILPVTFLVAHGRVHTTVRWTAPRIRKGLALVVDSITVNGNTFGVSFTLTFADLGAGSDPKSLCFLSNFHVPVKDLFCPNTAARKRATLLPPG